MSSRRVLFYFAWSRPAESSAALTEISDRFPALFELRRLYYPKFEKVDPERAEQGIGGFLDHVQKANFTAFSAFAEKATGNPVKTIERVLDDGTSHALDPRLLDGIDTLVVISFDSNRTAQRASTAEIEAIRAFLETPDHLAFLCPHHDIGADPATQEAEFTHHGDHASPPRQAFGGFAVSLLAGLGVPVQNRYGLRPADGPIVIDAERDRLRLLHGVHAFNQHSHLPHLERLGEARDKLDVLAKTRVNPAAPPHPYPHETFDSLLQSRADVFAGTLLVGDTTLFSSTQGGLANLERLWTNVVSR